MSNYEDEKLNGIVERIVFRNEDNGWTVFELYCDGSLETAVGKLPPLSVGEYVSITGKYIDHASFGKQLQIETIERKLPNDSSAILRYLSAGSIKGIGPATAVKIVKKFGEDTLRIIENYPERLAEISGITQNRANQIHDDFMSMFGLRETMMRLASFGLTPEESMKCWKKWGLGAENCIQDNPYILCNYPIYIPFERVDILCQDRMFLPDDSRRVEAALVYVLRHNLQNGHTCIPSEKVIDVTTDLLSIDRQSVEDAKNQLVIKEELMEIECKERKFLFLFPYYDAERNIASIIHELSTYPNKKTVDVNQWISHVERITGIVYEEEQREAIRQALLNRVLIMTGGPGTGKTTTINAIIRLLKDQGETVLLAAPTGRAAKRMSELTGEDASTIHRLLEVQWDENDEPFFSRNEYNPLEADTVVLDELSMVDVLIFSNFLKALPAKCRLIMVGDTHQLPPVGAGNVLGDLIDSNAVPVIHLKKVFRQAQESQIVMNAHRIISGEYPILNRVDSDFFFLPTSSLEDSLNKVVDLCSRRLPNKYDFTVFDGIQVLTPGKKGKLGTEELNISLQEICNPSSADKPEWKIDGKLFRTGDKVMQMKNNYSIEWFKMNGTEGTGIYNGDIGTIVEIQKRNNQLTVQFDDGREATYSKENAEDLELAYATTVHKSQGSEFEIVVLSIYDVPKLLCYRNLLYTAITRAKKILVVVGKKEIIAQMVDNDKKTKRYSALNMFIEEFRGGQEEICMV